MMDVFFYLLGVYGACVYVKDCPNLSRFDAFLQIVCWPIGLGIIAVDKLNSQVEYWDDDKS